MEKVKEKTNKLGRPATIPWGSVENLWATHTTKQIAKELGTSYTNVFLKRKKLKAAAEAAGKSAAKYTCNQPAWTRVKSEVVEPETVESQT